MSTYSKDSAELEREVEAQRQKVESRIDEIRERLSPGQIVDELLSYTKNGGQNFAANLGQTVSNNPMPAALLGISLVWLMSGQGPKLSAGHSEPARPRNDYSRASEYPYATVSGGMRRVSHAADPSGKWYSEWEDTGGKRYKAESNELGHRVSEFMDDTGRKFGGLIDDTGHRVRDFQDEAGNRFEDAMGWASHTLHDMQHGVGETTRMAMDMFRDQPLVAGALAFAAGAAIGAALPHTDQEDQAIGKVADQVKGKAVEAASEVYEDGKAKAAELYEKGKDGAAQVYDDVRGQGVAQH